MKEIGRRSWKIQMTYQKEGEGKPGRPLNDVDYWPMYGKTTTLNNCLREWAMWRREGYDNGYWRIKFVNEKTKETILADAF